jgi:hypothetical protein
LRSDQQQVEVIGALAPDAVDGDVQVGDQARVARDGSGGGVGARWSRGACCGDRDVDRACLDRERPAALDVDPWSVTLTWVVCPVRPLTAISDGYGAPTPESRGLPAAGFAIGVGFEKKEDAEADAVTASEASTERTDSRISLHRSGKRVLLRRSRLIGMLRSAVGAGPEGAFAHPTVDHPQQGRRPSVRIGISKTVLIICCYFLYHLSRPP